MGIFNDIVNFLSGTKQTGQQTSGATTQTVNQNQQTGTVSGSTQSNDQTQNQNTTASANTTGTTAQSQTGTSVSGQNQQQTQTGTQTGSTSSLDPQTLALIQSVVGGSGAQTANTAYSTLNSILGGVPAVQSTIDNRATGGADFVNSAIDASNKEALQTYDQTTQRQLNQVASGTGSTAAGGNTAIQALQDEQNRKLGTDIGNMDAGLQFQGDQLNTNADLTALMGANQSSTAANNSVGSFANLLNVLKGGNITSTSGSTQDLVNNLTGTTGSTSNGVTGTASSSNSNTDVSSILNALTQLGGTSESETDLNSLTSGATSGTQAGTSNGGILDWLNSIGQFISNTHQPSQVTSYGWRYKSRQSTSRAR